MRTGLSTGLLLVKICFRKRRLIARVRGKSTFQLAVAIACVIAVLLPGAALSGTMEQAKRLHERLAGVPPTDPVLLDMTSDIIGGNAIAAAYTAMDNSAFYDVTLKNFAAPWTNEDQSVFVPLNDYTATVIGMIRDDMPFNTLLSANILYVGGGGLGLTPYSMTNNLHYEELEQSGLSLKDNLVQTSQTAVTDLPPAGVAGVLTTRAAAAAFFVAGTNRAMFRFTMVNHMCKDMEELKDITLAPDRIRQDVSRSPGGDSRIFLNNCIGCHTGMDPLTQSFAYHDYDETLGRIVYTPGQVQAKYFNNADNFRPGFATPDDSWSNYWREGQNQLLGWDTGRPDSGNGAASMGAELANSTAFAQCQVKKVFRAVCFREPSDAADRSKIDEIVTSFRSGGSYRMKQVFAEAAVYCMGQ